jgi:molybdopterin-binding protein
MGLAGIIMKISARNFIQGKIVDVQKGATTAHISIEISGCVLTASITNESVEELGLEKGKDASAIIKSSDVMIAVD